MTLSRIFILTVAVVVPVINFQKTIIKTKTKLPKFTITNTDNNNPSNCVKANNLVNNLILPLINRMKAKVKRCIVMTSIMIKPFSLKRNPFDFN
jgi:hypothetical protein